MKQTKMVNQWRTIGTLMGGLLLLITNAFGQAGTFSGVAQGVSAEATGIVAAIGGVLVIIMGVWLYASPSHGLIGKLIGMVIGLFIILNPTRVAAFIQGL